MKVHTCMDGRGVKTCCGKIRSLGECVPLRRYIDLTQQNDPNLCRRCARSRAVQDALQSRRAVSHLKGRGNALGEK